MILRYVLLQSREGARLRAALRVDPEHQISAAAAAQPGFNRLCTSLQPGAAGEKSEVVEVAVREAIATIEEDAADVITFGCSALFWLQPILQSDCTTRVG